MLFRSIRPFVYRRHLDYGVIASIRDLHAQIQREAEKRSAAHQGRSHDIKLGRGGIREIEFLAQMFQLMRGGTDPRLRVRPTLEVLGLIQQRGILLAEDIQKLECAYVFLRRLEHRIQVWDDQQTHYLPDDNCARSRLAKTMGFDSEPNFLVELEQHQNNVARLFEKAFLLNDAARLELTPADQAWEPDTRRYPQALLRWQAWTAGPKAKLLPEKSRSIFNGLMRSAAEKLAAEDGGVLGADQVLLRFFEIGRAHV